MNIFKNNLGKALIIKGFGKNKIGTIIERGTDGVTLSINGWPIGKKYEDIKLLKEETLTNG